MCAPGMEGKPAAADEARRLYDEAEAKTGRGRGPRRARPFGELLAKVTENALFLVKLGSDAADLVVRNLRLAGRRDITGLARQLARTEDKLELVLQEVERLRSSSRPRAGARARQASNGGPRARTPPGGRQVVNARRAAVAIAGRGGRVREHPLPRATRRSGRTPKDVVWTHRKTTLYRYRSTQRRQRCRSCSSSR